MSTWHHFLEAKAWDFVLGVGSSKKLDPTLDKNLETFFGHEITKGLTLGDVSTR